MRRVFQILRGSMGFQRQLVLTFTVGIICLSLLSSWAIATLASRTIRITLLEHGIRATEAFAAESTLALLYRSADNARAAVEATLAFPDIQGVAIYDLERRPLVAEGKEPLPPGEELKWPPVPHFAGETDEGWFFVAPVYARPASAEEESPFVLDAPDAKLIGFVRVVMVKDTLKKVTGDILQGNVFVSLALALLLLLVLLGVMTRITAPLKELAESMRRAELGEKNVRAEIHGPQDIMEMENAFNTMMAVLEAREQELKQARDAALESARIKGEFAANVSHELRTPLNGILGMLELLQGMGLTPKQREYLQVACNSGEKLLGLISDILDFSRIEAGKLRLEFSDFSLSEVLEDVVGLLARQAQQKDLGLGYVIAPNVPPIVRGDAARIRQILINLVGNAVRFTDQGEVTIEVEARGKPPQKALLCFWVRDTGIGIPPEAQGRIFEAFSQADSSTTRKYGGTGLGLTICCQLVALLGGDIGVESRPGKGSTFWFTVPLQAVKAPVRQHDEVASLPPAERPQPSSVPEASAEGSFHGRRLLVVEDNRANQQVALGMLERLGCRADVVANGREALEAMARQSYDLVLMDCHMPEMDGYEATRRFRASERARPRLPIIAMTANVNREDSDKCFAVGMSDYLPKPLKLNGLRDKLQYWLGSRRTGLGLPVPAPAANEDNEDKDMEMVLDRRVLSELRASVGDTFYKMIEVFLEDTPPYLEQLQSAIRENNAHRLREVAHSIKGSARNFGAAELAQAAKQLEELGNGGSMAGAQTLLTRLIAAYQRVERELQRERQPVDKETSASQEREQCRVLIVDDDRGMRLALRNVLAQDGYRIQEAENGEQALALCEQCLPDLVLMDAVMPVMDGFEACTRIRELPQGTHTPVLIITALDDEISIKQAFSAGATDYIPKPVHFAVLRRRVARLLDASRAEKHVYQLAYHDTLTGLPNRALFRKHLEEAMARVRREESLALLFLDLDRFKLVNDTLGHDVGDLLLKAAAERISGCLRAGDMVARLGGDEFTVILENIRSLEAVEKVAGKICEALSRPFVFAGQEMYISTSIGIALYPRDGKDRSALIKHADTAMFRAKERGDGFRFYERGMGTAATGRLVLEAALRRALERSEFTLCYQPQVNPVTGKLNGLEALIRWRHPAQGLVSPAKFIPLAEDTGLIVPIGEWALREACTQVQTWLQRGLGPLQIAVNVSGRQLERGDLVAKVMSILKETGLPPALLELEITESVVMQHAERVLPMFRGLRAVGVKLAIDDFGTGYSSLNYLKRFPVDTLKIDRSFICDIATNPDDEAILAGIIALARSLRLKVVAEGVETREQEAILKAHWCDLIQGFYLSQPLSAEAIEQTILAQERAGASLSEKIFPLSTKHKL